MKGTMPDSEVTSAWEYVAIGFMCLLICIGIGGCCYLVQIGGATMSDKAKQERTK